VERFFENLKENYLIFFNIFDGRGINFVNHSSLLDFLQNTQDDDDNDDDDDDLLQISVILN